ncbi:hypothetical protein [Pseudonocardia xishanensis]|uniref:DUF3558 domain-containing protein n=1 Tax=Pseudonocardia xishanensis TaxID=630995 RepID=A0ABP8RSR3_9PSEU
MRVRSDRLSARALHVLLLVGMVAGLAACAGAESAGRGDAPSSAAGAPTSAAGTAGPQPGTAALPQACALVSKSELDRVTGLVFGEPAATDGATRSVCAFSATGAAPGLTVGVEPAARFEAKAAASRSSVGVPGVEVPDLGERALFFYSDADFPQGLGGVLLQAGGATVDISLQGSGDEARTRELALAIARLALTGL